MILYETLLCNLFWVSTQACCPSEQSSGIETEVCFGGSGVDKSWLLSFILMKDLCTASHIVYYGGRPLAWYGDQLNLINQVIKLLDHNIIIPFQDLISLDESPFFR